MTLICPNCQTRLQLDEAKTPSRPFTVRCPKCQTSVKLDPASANSSEASPASSGTLLDRHLAQRFTLDGGPETSKSSQESGDLAKLLVNALRQANLENQIQGGKRGKRRALVCIAPEHQAETARILTEQRYEVFVAQNTSQALGSMREDRMDVLFLAEDFDPVEKGTAFVMREVKLLRPAQRRRLFIVYVSASMRTLDLHSAFLQNVNLVFNPADMDKLPEVMETSLRSYNDLYRDFFKALNVQQI
jgi:predicted Zn finger-like uncharacterized protein